MIVVVLSVAVRKILWWLKFHNRCVIILFLDEVNSDVLQIVRRVLRLRAVQLSQVVVFQHAILLVVNLMGESIIKVGTVLAVNFHRIFPDNNFIAIMVKYGNFVMNRVGRAAAWSFA